MKNSISNPLTPTLSRGERGSRCAVKKCVDTYALREKATTAWMHDSRDGGGRAASGTAAEEVGQRRERLPRMRGS